jgi:hypothetical protein
MSYTEVIAEDQREQADIIAILQSTPGIQGRVQVLSQMKGDTVNDLDNALAGLTGGGFPGGAAIAVLEPEEPDGSVSDTALIFPREHIIKITEVRSINKLADGTLLCGVNRYNLRDLVKVALHGQWLGKAALQWASAKPFADTKDGETIFGQGFIVRFRIETQNQQWQRNSDPQVQLSGGDVVLTGKYGQRIVWTVDGSTPIQDGPTTDSFSPGQFGWPYTHTLSGLASGTRVRVSGNSVSAPTAPDWQTISGIVEITVP